uniref:Uncharacterized protein n=1 Tax=Biomphalaria glabrata TaxID=6526 RepID=A0A2C9KX64_BIOGL
MTAYAKEFEKWLSNSGSLNQPVLLEDDDSNAIKTSNPQSGRDDSGGGDSSQGSFDDVMKDSLSFSTINQSAPILVDDEEDEEFYKDFDEPPVLKPVSKQTGQNKTPPISSPRLTQESIFSYSRTKRSYSRQRSLEDKDLKTYSGKKSFRHTLSDDYEKRHEKNGKESGNIFDKFSSEKYDSPPPLLPGPECEPLPEECHSPDFRAMEADSTSEPTCDKEVHTSRQSSQVKSLEASLECDSTCMLGTSPAIVSPASLSCGESEEMKDMSGADETEAVKDVLVADETEAVKDVLVADETECNAVENFSGHERDLKGLSNTIEEQVTQDMPVLPFPVNQMHEKSSETQASFTHAVHDHSDINNDEPPTLAIMPQLNLSLIGVRQKRHTIDTPETYCRTHRQQCSHEGPVPSSPPTLTCFIPNENVPTSNRKRSNKTLNDSCAGEVAEQQKKCRHFSYPSTDQSSNLQNFVQQACLLSQLQTRLHSFLFHIFPQIRSDLKKIQPESLLLETVLSDLVSILDHPEEGKKIGNSRTCSQASVGLSSPQAVSQSLPLETPQLTTSESLNVSLSAPSDDSLQQSPSLVSQDNELALAKLSQLSLREPHVKSAVILLAKDPAAELSYFCQLTCKVLQHLLPELAVKLLDELVDSPKDLLVFLDNVILINTRSKWKTSTR